VADQTVKECRSGSRGRRWFRRRPSTRWRPVGQTSRGRGRRDLRRRAFFWDYAACVPHTLFLGDYPFAAWGAPLGRVRHRRRTGIRCHACSPFPPASWPTPRSAASSSAGSATASSPPPGVDLPVRQRSRRSRTSGGLCAAFPAAWLNVFSPLIYSAATNRRRDFA
jgi:hypothetical protein